MKLTNAFERYYMILSLLMREDYIATIENISCSLDLPIEQIRKDFKELMLSSVIQPHMLFASAANAAPIEFDYFFDMLSSSQKHTISSDLLSGVYNQTIFSLEGSELGFDSDSLLLPINHIEYLALKDVYPEFVQHFSKRPDVFEKLALPSITTKQSEDILEYLWGSSYNSDEKIEDVTLIIENVTPNLLEKIQSETFQRKHGTLTCLENKTYIYKDKIIGLEAFKRWLLSYGSAIIVQRPKHLALEMYESAKQIYENHKTAKFK